MSLVTWDKFTPSVAPWAPDCPGLVITDALRKAAYEFCKESGAWSISNDPQGASANVAEYDIDSPSGTVIVTLQSVTYSGIPLEAKTPDQLDLLIPNWAAAVGTPSFYVRTSDSTVLLVPMPADDLAAAIVTRVIVAPDPLTGAGVDSDLTDKFFEAIPAGALSRLLLMPGTWVNPKLAQYNAAVFAAAKGDARAVAYAANSSAQLRVRGRRFV